MSRNLFIAAVSVMAAVGQQLPLAGWFAGPEETIVPVWGVAGNLVAGQAMGPRGVLLAARGDVAVVRGQDEAIVLVSGEEALRLPVEARAVAGVDANGSVRLLLPERRLLLTWSGGAEPREHPWAGDEEVLAISEAAWVARREDTAWIVTAAGARTPLGSGVTAAVLWTGETVLLVRDGRLLFLARGEETDLGPTDGSGLVRTGEDWAQAGRIGIRRRGNSVERFVVPGAAPR